MRGAARLACLGLAACSPSAVTPPLASRPPEAYELPRGDALPAWRRACTGAPAERDEAGDARAKRKIYDFTPTPLPANLTRPTIAERSRAGPARSQHQVEELLGLGFPQLSSCWRWASARGASPGTVELVFDVDPFGRAGAVSARSAAPAHDELVACIEDTFAPVTPLLSGRTTRMRARVRFAPSGQVPPAAPSERPRRAAPIALPSFCIPVTEVRDDVDAATVFVVDNFDHSRTSLPHGQPPPVHGGCGRVVPRDLDKAEIRLAFASNAGAFGACYRAARQRTPGLAGELAIHAAFAVSSIEEVSVTGPGDAAFHACVATATKALWLPARPHGNVVEATFRYALLPEAPPLLAGSPPEAHFAAHDFERALAAWGEQLARPRALSAAAACRARAGVVRSLAQLAPWLDDPRVLAATRDLMRHAAAIDPAEATACLADVQKLLADIGIPRRFTDQWSTIHRIESVLPGRHLLADQPRLHAIYGEQLIAHGRHELARAELAHVEPAALAGEMYVPALRRPLGPERELQLKCVRP